MNKTNMKMLIKLYGDDEERLVGKKIKLEVILVRNPQTGENVRGLAVSPKQKVRFIQQHQSTRDESCLLSGKTRGDWVRSGEPLGGTE